jgi:hypothetical protein
MSSIIETMLESRKATTENATQVFDSLEPATIEFMFGRWKGYEIVTQHPMDGFLAPSGWYGKMFINKNEVHPLLFFTSERKGVYPVNPILLPSSSEDFKKSKQQILDTIQILDRSEMEAKETKARLRNVQYRGRVCATMAYDEKPIFDVFVKIDDKRVLGAMDWKGLEAPYFFVLERDDDSEYKLDF